MPGAVSPSRATTESAPPESANTPTSAGPGGGRTYVEKFESKLPSKTVARYFQLENKFEAIVEFELARRIPLVQ